MVSRLQMLMIGLFICCPTSGLRLSRHELLVRATAAAAACGPAVKAFASTAPEKTIYYTPPSVKGSSSAAALQLAEHLKASGASMYGAYWCSHCYEQKVAFGARGTKLLNYVECAADGYQSQRKLCGDKEIKGYPTWEIGGKFYPGEQSLRELAELSNFPKLNTLFPE